MGNGECCSGFGKQVCPFISRKSSMTGGPTGRLRVTWEERESKRSQISQKDFGWRNTMSEERRVRGNWEFVRKRAD